MARDLGRATHKSIMKGLGLHPKTRTPAIILTWLEAYRMAIDGDERSNLSIRKAGSRLLSQAIETENEVAINLADITYRIAPRFIAWEADRMVEGTFIQNHLTDMIDIIFGSNELLTYEWTNKQMMNVNLTLLDDNASLIPDYVSSVIGNRGQVMNVFVIKAKAPQRNQKSDDFFKVAQEMKCMVTNLVEHGVSEGEVCGLLVDGWECTAYTMFLKHEAVYGFVQIGAFDLIKRTSGLPLLEDAVEVLETVEVCIYVFGFLRASTVNVAVGNNLNTASLIEDACLPNVVYTVMCHIPVM
ncbi:hypothetical protein BJV82DRAFT_243981 [Fennellomyces sp. T-0311]|nr:hypothetical protein BJV82DRAFT_243981 [Fennellomyces sp. T-0311]